MPMFRLVLSFLLLVPAAAPAIAAAQVRHCVTPDGQQIFTDRECAAVGGVEQKRPQPVASAAQPRRGGCARNVDDLVFEMNGAFQSRDANKLASVYHWAGMTGSVAYDVMARLDELVQRPLIDIVQVVPGDPDPAVVAGPPFPAFQDALVPAAEPRPRVPVALRVEQTLANGITPSRTVFGLQKHFGCWWIKG